MNHKMIATLEAHPALGWLTSLLSFVLGLFGWAVEHVDLFTKAFGLVATIFGCIAGWYTIRVQRRTLQKLNGSDTTSLAK
jgi:hypothetical protein